MPPLSLHGADWCIRDATDVDCGIVDVRVTSTDEERSVVVHVHIGRTRAAIVVTARSPAWVPFVRLPEALMLDEGDFAALARATRAAFRVWRRHFG